MCCAGVLTADVPAMVVDAQLQQHARANWTEKYTQIKAVQNNKKSEISVGGNWAFAFANRAGRRRHAVDASACDVSTYV